jgi:hypothetical protein
MVAWAQQETDAAKLDAQASLCSRFLSSAHGRRIAVIKFLAALLRHHELRLGRPRMEAFCDRLVAQCRMVGSPVSTPLPLPLPPTAGGVR